jgi:hypothetical protein
VRRLGNASRNHDPRRAEVLEALVELYLRLNGYFSIRNYLQHRVEEFGLLTESDLLAIRMPRQEEVLENGRRQLNDPTLILPEDQLTVDCVIAEVKEASVEFNSPIRGRDGARLIVTALRMFGVLPKDAFSERGLAHQIASDLHTKICSIHWVELPESHNTEQGICVRMLVFAPSTATHASRRKHFDLQHVLDFSKSRMRPGEECATYRNLACPSASPWRGCTRLIVETLDASHSEGEINLPLEEFLKRVVSRLAG